MYTQQGKGVEDQFAGLPAAYSNIEKSQIAIVPVAFDLTTTYQKGSDNGPSAIIEASRNLELYDIETDSQVFLKGIFTDDDIEADDSQSMLSQTYERVKFLLNKNKFVVTLGGEHSISYAPIRAYADRYSELTVLQFDAHTDLVQSYEQNRWSHACVMARVKELPNVKKVVAVGIRSMSAEELPYLDRENTFFAHQLYGNEDWIEQVMQRLHGPIYITFDLDAFDSSLMPSTGTPEPGGLQWYAVMKLLKRVAQERNLVGFDLVELCPQLGNSAPDYLAAKLVYKLLSYKFQEVKR